MPLTSVWSKSRHKDKEKEKRKKKMGKNYFFFSKTEKIDVNFLLYKKCGHEKTVINQDGFLFYVKNNFNNQCD